MPSIAEQIQKAEKLKLLIEKYPDLEISTDRWNNEWLISKSSAKLCDKFTIRRSCGCCDDAVVYLVPYFTDCSESIYYHHKGGHAIGEGSYFDIKGINLDKILEKLRKDEIQETLIEKIKIDLESSIKKEDTENDKNEDDENEDIENEDIEDKVENGEDKIGE